VSVCTGKKRSGARCTVSVAPGLTYCHHHDPARAEERSRAASRAGKSKPSKELSDIKQGVKDLIADVLEGNVDKGRGAVALQGYNTWLRAVEIGQRVDLEALAREVEEIKKSGYGGTA
jgi:hypothetical protein